MPMKYPSHPGSILRGGYLKPLDLNVSEAARLLGVSRQLLHRLLSGRARISAEMAVRLSKAFGTTPELWLRLQMNYDLAQVRLRASEIDVKRYRKAS